MAQQSRHLQKIFGSTGGTSEFGRIGSEAAGSPTTTKDLDNIQSLSQYLLGLYAITASANEPPRIQDINALYFLITSQLSYLFQVGVPEYLATEEYYVNSVVIDSNGDQYISLTGTDGSPNQGNTPSSSPSDWRLLVDNAGALNKAVAGEIHAITEKTSIVSDDEFVIEDSADSNNKKRMKFSTMRNSIQGASVHEVTDDYTITTSDGYTGIDIAHSLTTKLVEIDLPDVSANNGRKVRVQNTGSASGLTYANGDGTNILFKNNVLPKLKLLTRGDYIDFRSNGTYWIVEHINFSLETKWINCNDYTNRHMASAFTYDNKSTPVDLTGQHITLASGNTAIIYYDSGATSTSGIHYCYEWTGDGLAINNEQGTCGSGGYTFDVNEGSGSSKNQDYTFVLGLGIDFIEYTEIDIFVSTDGTWSNMLRTVHCTYSTGATDFYGVVFIHIDTNTIEAQSGDGGIAYLNTLGQMTGNIITTDDYYYIIKIGINF